MFKGKKGQERAQDIGKRSKTFVPGEKLVEKTGPSKEDVELIKVAQYFYIVCIITSGFVQVMESWKSHRF